MREREVERKLVEMTGVRKGIAPKFVSPGTDGMPDRIVLLPGGRMGFVEVKAPGKSPRPNQAARIRKLRWLGFRVYVVDNVDMIGGVLDDIQGA